MSLNEDLQRGQKVRMLDGNHGTIRGRTDNFGFPLWEIVLANGKVLTEARYRFDIVQDDKPSMAPSGTTSTNNNKLQTSDENALPSDFEYLADLFEDEIEDHNENIHQLIPPPPSQPRPHTIKKPDNMAKANKHIKPIKFNNKPRQFASVSENELEQFISEQENKRTVQKTQGDMKILKQFLSQNNENREIYEIPPSELNGYLGKFFYAVRKSNGEEYEPNTLRGMMCSFDRVLRKNNYSTSIKNGDMFSKTRDVMVAKQINLKKMGKGNGVMRAEALTDEDINTMFEAGELGMANPTVLLHTVWFFNSIFFGLRGVAEHHQMRWGDVTLCKDSKGVEYLAMNERNTKTRTGADPKNIREIPQRAWANISEPQKCPVAAYKLYKNKRPAKYSDPEHPFYIQENTNPEKSTLWFKSQPVGVNKLGKFMRQIATNSGLIENKENEDAVDADCGNQRRLTNHSARRFMLQKLDDSGYEHNHIKQISGHKNVQSVANYAKLSLQKHQQISESLLKLKTSTASSSATITSSQVREVNIIKPHVAQPQCTASAGPLELGIAPHALFAGPIYGGTFNVYMAGPNNDKSKEHSPIKRRRIIIDSDSD